MLDGKGEQDAKDAQRHVVLLTSDLVSCGHQPMDIVMTDPGPFNPGFIIPAPLNGGTYVHMNRCMFTNNSTCVTNNS